MTILLRFGLISLRLVIRANLSFKIRDSIFEFNVIAFEL